MQMRLYLLSLVLESRSKRACQLGLGQFCGRAGGCSGATGCHRGKGSPIKPKVGPKDFDKSERLSQRRRRRPLRRRHLCAADRSIVRGKRLCVIIIIIR